MGARALGLWGRVLLWVVGLGGPGWARLVERTEELDPADTDGLWDWVRLWVSASWMARCGAGRVDPGASEWRHWLLLDTDRPGRRAAMGAARHRRAGVPWGEAG